MKKTLIRFYKNLRNRPIRNDLTIYEDDIFLVSYPRSGNTWVRFILGTLLSDEKITWETMEKGIPDMYRNTDKELKDFKRPRIIKSHHSFDPRYNKVVYLVRDVRDVVLSYYNYHIKFNKISDTYPLDRFIDKFMEGELDDFGSWSENVKSWISNKKEVENGFMLFRYEDLKDDTFSEIRRMADFLGIDPTDDEVRDAIEWSSFSNMRKLENEQSNSNLFNNSDKEVKFTNKGSYGYWKQELNKEQVRLLTDKNKELLKDLGYQA
ncbi:sulfotransferase domain-containing protein [Aliifodinibius salicampi]|uniref:Sulfotransferase domain-containing protein n=1 Tax=Fodinibius salicampi TaxID=1920655 RepID=A0ABT3PYZ1_9BACT|nr:sulfotransferase domain-containing protein [Fodinibius salicampi]MCW9713069.1 sulfotransferase domain-containing protein [Fodinibius salicampi]